MSAEMQQAEREQITVIQPSVRWTLGLAEALSRHELLSLFVTRQISARYRQMFLGVLWALIEPLGQLLLLTVVFGYLLKVNTGGYPYPVFAFAGMAAWLLFSRATLAVAGSLQENMGLISKVYFPRLILPLAAVLRELFDAMLMIVLLLALAMAYGFPPTPRLLVLPVILMCSAMLALAVGLWMATLIVKFRDVRPILSLALQAGMYATPVVYSADLVPERFRFAYELNPMFWAVEFSRWALFGKEIVVSSALGWSVAASLLLLLGGLIVFSLFERMSVDVQ
jgi:lipopolysaccharide transport system permease protein